MSASSPHCERVNADLQYMDAVLGKIRASMANAEADASSNIGEVYDCLIRRMDEARAKLDTLKNAGPGMAEDLSRTLDGLVADLKATADSVLARMSPTASASREPRGIIEAINQRVEIERSETGLSPENGAEPPNPQLTTVEVVCGGLHTQQTRADDTE